MIMKTHHPKLTELVNSAHAFCSDMWENPMKGGLMVICGENGSGKTHAARAISHWVHQVGGNKQYVPSPGHVARLSCLYAYWPTLLDELKGGRWTLVDGPIETPVLILDDLGASHDPSLVGVDKLCRILSERERGWTVVTTNIAPDRWEEVFDRRVASRLFRNSRLVNLMGVPDFMSV